MTEPHGPAPVAADPVEVGSAYERIREGIIGLSIPPGAPIKVDRLARELGLSAAAVAEALALLAHERLVVITALHEHGIYVPHINLEELDELSEMRLRLEGLSARLAAERAGPDDLAVMEALLAEQRAAGTDESRRALEVDKRLHQAIAAAARNRYLAEELDRLFALSQRMWNAALPRLAAAHAFPAAARSHAGLVEAIRARDGDAAGRIMREHVALFHAQVRGEFSARVTVHYGRDARSVGVEGGSLLGGAIIAAGLPLEQPCAGRGTCLKCKVLAEGALSPPDEHEQAGLTPAERAASYRLACRARVVGDVSVTLAPMVVYSNKVFGRAGGRLRPDVPLGLAVDLGTTTVAAFVAPLDRGAVVAGAAALNQQMAFGADIISRLDAALSSREQAARLSTLAITSIVLAMDALKLTRPQWKRIRRVTIVGNCAMHHLLLRLPVETLAELPFQPHSRETVRISGDTPDNPLSGLFPPGAEVVLAPLVGGFVGSDALACLLYYDFDRAEAPIAAIDLGTNGEVLVTDGRRVMAGSTAAGPAFEGLNISCGTRAVDGAIVAAAAAPGGEVHWTTIGNQPPVGLTGSGLLSLVCELRHAGVIEASGRLAQDHPIFGHRIGTDASGVRRFLITDQGVDRRGLDEDEEASRVPLYLTQHDIRELQKAKAAIRATFDTLLDRLGLHPTDLKRMILTGSFGSQVDTRAILGLGMIPPMPREVIETSANGAGLGAALMLDDEQLGRAERIAALTEQIDLDLDPGFDRRFVGSMALTPDGG